MNAETAATLLEAIMNQEDYMRFILWRMGDAKAGFKKCGLLSGRLFGVGSERLQTTKRLRYLDYEHCLKKDCSSALERARAL